MIIGMNKLVLFDIDGTLVAGAHGHAEAFAIAFKEVYVVNASIYMINPNGMTDQEIILAVMKKAGVEESLIEARIHDCMGAMVTYFKSIQPMLTVKLLPGVEAFLAALKTKGYLMGLVTGNLEPIGRAKMEIVGLGDYFSVGGFGSDATASNLSPNLPKTPSSAFSSTSRGLGDWTDGSVVSFGLFV